MIRLGLDRYGMLPHFGPASEETACEQRVAAGDGLCLGKLWLTSCPRKRASSKRLKFLDSRFRGNDEACPRMILSGISVVQSFLRYGDHCRTRTQGREDISSCSHASFR